MTITNEVARRIVGKLLQGEDYRIEVVGLINAEFLQFSVNFFKRVIEAKLANQSVTLDWYTKEFLNEDLQSKEIAINSGLNMKTIHNMFNSSTKQIVIKASNDHYDLLTQSIEELVETSDGLEMNLNLKFGDVTVGLDISETLILINTLAVKRAELRGGLWSAAGKRVEKPLMETLCKLYGVSPENYKLKVKSKVLSKEEYEREIDFYLIDSNGRERKCEVKLMGRGNPESADAVIARDSSVFVADKLSDTNKKQLNELGVSWVELRAHEGFHRFKKVLEDLGIPHEQKFTNDTLDDMVDLALSEILN